MLKHCQESEGSDIANIRGVRASFLPERLSYMSEKKYIPELVGNDMGRYFAEGFDALYADGAKTQDEILNEIISLTANSDYAHDKGFAGISTKEEFRAKVPLSEYGDYVSYVHSNMEHDNGQLIALPTEYYLMSTGRNNSNGKYYSETHVGAVARQRTIDVYQMGIVRNEPVLSEPGFKTMPVVNSTYIPAAPNGKPVRRTSSQAGKELWRNGGDVFVFPYEFLEAQMGDEDRNYLYALYAVKEEELVQTNCNNLAAFGDFLDCIEASPRQMIDDIRTGHLSVVLSDADRALLEGLFEADPARADALQAMLDEDGFLDPNRMWPRFRLVTGWIGGSVGSYSCDVMARLPRGVRYYNTPYGSTETMIAATSDPGSAAGPLAVFACYFEFLPIDGGAPVEMRDLEVGACYEILVSTYSGLLRYNLHDIVRVTGFWGETACIEFRGRSSEFFQAGNKRYGFQFCDMVEAAGEGTGIVPSVFQGLPEADGSLSVIVEPYTDPADLSEYANRVKAQLRAGGVVPGSVYVVKRGYRRGLYNSMKQMGRTVQSMKLPIFATDAPYEVDIRCVL